MCPVALHIILLVWLGQDIEVSSNVPFTLPRYSNLPVLASTIAVSTSRDDTFSAGTARELLSMGAGVLTTLLCQINLQFRLEDFEYVPKEEQMELRLVW